ncbi:MAG: DUF3137 domain-containing protein, partial [Alphaproteobacteria bacterium]|nr:DUF3137 domain-containing protein [Alphaproteobacteria bacterium]
DALAPSEIIPSHKKYHCEDYVRGTYKGVDLELTEATLTEGRSNGKHRRKTVNFRGLMILFAAHKPFAGKTFVKKDSGRLGNWLTDKFNKFETIELEDPDFESRFEVYGTDQVEARTLLTPSFMERLMGLAALFDDAKIECSFYDDKLLIMIPSDKDRFDAISPFQPVTFQDEINAILAEMALIFEIVDLLKLDRRRSVRG